MTGHLSTSYWLPICLQLLLCYLRCLDKYVIALPLHNCRLGIFIMMLFELLVDVYLGHYFRGNYGSWLVWLCELLGPSLAVIIYFHDHYMSHHGQCPPGLSAADCLS
ncbi:diacylglycerol O-acyltransferase 1-like isoform 1-T1 [Salvelinus alpinus]|uniref:diacylglycerol O-acyltransferase 1-like n=1 Tax=Salvelinus alpinus TaxID=8036 RepID=UPI0039FDC36E